MLPLTQMPNDPSGPEAHRRVNKPLIYSQYCVEVCRKQTIIARYRIGPSPSSAGGLNPEFDDDTLLNVLFVFYVLF